MQIKNYTHRGLEFEWWGGLNISKPNKIMPLKLVFNNGSLSWRLNRNTWLSVKQLKNIIYGVSNKIP